jgi:hypothetical protein
MAKRAGVFLRAVGFNWRNDEACRQARPVGRKQMPPPPRRAVRHDMCYLTWRASGTRRAAVFAILSTYIMPLRGSTSWRGRSPK